MKRVLGILSIVALLAMGGAGAAHAGALTLNRRVIDLYLICSYKIAMPDISWTYLGHSFVCDSNKRRINMAKHAVDLVGASTAFADPFGVTMFDGLHSDVEDRFTMIARNDAEVLLRITFTMRDEIIRLISARKATKNEGKLYASS